jgi:hypothetical protein
MVLKIEEVSRNSGTTLALIGRITSPDVQLLKARIADAAGPVALDLHQVRVVDLDAVRFLAAEQRRGLELRQIPKYVWEWILLEKSRLSDQE